jgi:membrane fusion protein (multidrug efflux system)
MADALTLDSSPAAGPNLLRLRVTESLHGETVPPPAGPNRRRKQLFGMLGAAVLVAAAGWGTWWFLAERGKVSTDNAYVGAETAEVTPRVAAAVDQVLVTDTQQVKAGQVLVVLDDSDAKLAVANAQAALGQAERKVNAYFADAEALSGQLDARQADVARADAVIASSKADVDRASVELKRRQALAASGAVSGDELTDAQNRLSTATAALQAAEAARTQALAQTVAAKGSRSANDALIVGASVDANPEVAAAKAHLAQAELDLSRTVIRAPVDGVVARKNVEVGQQVQVGQALMDVTPVGSAYVDANFKEVQLKQVRIGQPVVLTSDLYGKGVKYHGHVVGLAGGTGAAFSLLPAQNATGNWIKVVQRLPVRVSLDPAELRQHPLRVGLSMDATIDVETRN